VQKQTPWQHQETALCACVAVPQCMPYKQLKCDCQR